MAQDDVELIWKYLENKPGAEITVDLVGRTVSAGEIVAPFEIDDYTRWRLLEGLDDISLTLRHEDDVADFEQTRPSYKPVGHGTLRPSAVAARRTEPMCGNRIGAVNDDRSLRPAPRSRRARATCASVVPQRYCVVKAIARGSLQRGA